MFSVWAVRACVSVIAGGVVGVGAGVVCVTGAVVGVVGGGVVVVVVFVGGVVVVGGGVAGLRGFPCRCHVVVGERV